MGVWLSNKKFTVSRLMFDRGLSGANSFERIQKRDARLLGSLTKADSFPGEKNLNMRRSHRTMRMIPDQKKRRRGREDLKKFLFK